MSSKAIHRLIFSSIFILTPNVYIISSFSGSELGISSRAFADDLRAPIDTFWPFNQRPHEWTLLSRAQIGSAPRRSLMHVRSETLGTDRLVLWFTGKLNQARNLANGEAYHLCKDGWIYLDAYIDQTDGKRIEHLVEADKILFTPLHGTSVDLLKDGSYEACGTKGQPYLLAENSPNSYRIQVWGHLTERQSWRWYWDATVEKRQTEANQCANLIASSNLLRIQEAWWSNFRESNGRWQLGFGDLGPDHAPTGQSVSYGRTIWHESNGTPYAMAGDPAGKVNWCAVQ